AKHKNSAQFPISDKVSAALNAGALSFLTGRGVTVEPAGVKTVGSAKVAEGERGEQARKLLRKLAAEVRPQAPDVPGVGPGEARARSMREANELAAAGDVEGLQRLMAEWKSFVASPKTAGKPEPKVSAEAPDAPPAGEPLAADRAGPTMDA